MTKHCISPLAINDIMTLRPKEMDIRTFEPKHDGISDFTACEATFLTISSPFLNNEGHGTIGGLAK